MFQASVLAVVAVLTAVDRLTKYWAVKAFKSGGTKEFFFGLFQFRYVENTGAAFGFFSGNVKLLLVFTSAFLAVCLIILLKGKIKSKFFAACLSLVIAGGLGNVIDRAVYGYAIDFIEPLFIDFAVYNFADCCITVGAAALIAREIYDLVKNGKKKAK